MAIHAEQNEVQLVLVTILLTVISCKFWGFCVSGVFFFLLRLNSLNSPHWEGRRSPSLVWKEVRLLSWCTGGASARCLLCTSAGNDSHSFEKTHSQWHADIYGLRVKTLTSLCSSWLFLACCVARSSATWVNPMLSAFWRYLVWEQRGNRLDAPFWTTRHACTQTKHFTDITQQLSSFLGLGDV